MLGGYHAMRRPVLVWTVSVLQTAGTVSMDMLAVDLTPCPQAGIGTPVELWGKEITSR